MDASELIRRRQARTVFRGMVEKQQYYESENISKGIGVNVGTKMSGSGKYPEWVYLVQQGNLFTTPEELPGATVQTVSAPTVAPPAAPTITSISGANTVLSVYFTAPTSDGGSIITDYEVSTDNGLTFQLAGSTSSPLTINSLTNGTAYQVVIRAVNAAGSGTASSAVSGTPVTTPLAPTITGITSGNTTLSVAFTAPASNGGSPITDYEVSTNNGVSYISAGTTTSPILLTGLANGTTYQVVIRAVNSVPGSGVASNVASGTPATTPSAPTITSVTAGNTTLSVSFTAPASNGGSAITGYEVSTNNGSTYTSAGSSPGSITVTGLTNGTTYQVVVRAVNSIGSGTASTAVSGTPAAPAGPTGAIGQAVWVTYIGENTSAVNSKSVITDSQGNVYITGIYTYTASSIIVQNVNGSGQTPSNITLPATSSGGAIFIIKYNESGQAQWATNLDGLSGTSSSPDWGYSIKVDSQDNIYVSGSYQASTSVTINDANGISQSTSAVTLTYPTNNGNAILLIKYNSNGQAQWATYFDGVQTFERSEGLYVDSLNNIYITGFYQQTTTALILKNASGTTQINSSYTLPTTAGSGDMFVVKYDSSGQVIWGTCISGTSVLDYGYYITGDSSGNIYITGQTRAATIKDASGFTQINSSVTLQPMTNLSMYLVCYNSGGIAQWATYVNPSNNAAGYGISLDSQNNIYVTGFYTHAQITSSTFVLKDASGTGQSDSLVTLPHTTLNGTNRQSIFLIKYNSSGKVQWAVGIIADGLSYSGNVICDSTDNIYICGRYNSSSIVYLPNANGNTQSSSSIVLPAPGANPDAYLIKYNSFGQAQWGLNIGGQGFDQGNALTIDMNGSIYITGAYGGTNTPVIINNANGNGQTSSSVSMPAQTSSSGYGYLIKYS